MAKPEVLIAGASVAGPCLAHWLVRAGCNVTIVEKTPQLQTNGQSIDIRNDGVRIMRKMDIEEKVKAKTTSEKGVQFINTKGKIVATIGATGNAEQQSFTSEYEIFRGDLAQILYDLTKDRVKYIFGETIQCLAQNETAHTVTAEFNNGTPTQDFDLVVGCDGLGSRTRAMAFEKDIRTYLKPLSCYAAWFTIKQDVLGGSGYAKWLICSGGRGAMVRPDPTGANRVTLTVVGPSHDDFTNIQKYLDAERSDVEKLKKLIADEFQGAGWETEKLIAGMFEADDFYSGEIAQIQTPTLFQGRIALCGDSGYCPSPISGSGTTCAFVGAYLLAGEISKSIQKGESLDEALKRYDTEMIPRARKMQSLMPGAPQIINPQTRWGVSVFQTILSTVSSLGIVRLMERLSGTVSFGKGAGIPDFEWAN